MLSVWQRIKNTVFATSLHPQRVVRFNEVYQANNITAKEGHLIINSVPNKYAAQHKYAKNLFPLHILSIELFMTDEDSIDNKHRNYWLY